MVFCPNCGAQVEGRFCAKCGTAVSQPAPGAGPGYAGGPTSTTPPPPNAYTTKAEGLTDNAASALCYALGFISGIVFLVLEPYNKNRLIRFHAWQSIFVFGAWLLIRIVLGQIIGMLYLTLGFFAALPALLLLLFGLLALGVWIFLMVKAYKGEKFMLPVIGPLAEKQANS